jgi:trehalose-6-phosphate synthase
MKSQQEWCFQKKGCNKSFLSVLSSLFYKNLYLNLLPFHSDSSSGKLNVYDELGFKEEQIALGINPEEVLQWLGTREDIITQLIEDNGNKIDRAKAELEVDKLLLDYEVVSKFMAYKKWAAENPETAAKVAEIAAKEGKINFQEISLYALWIAAGVGLSYFSKIVRGYWDASHPQLPNIDG